MSLVGNLPTSRPHCNPFFGLRPSGGGQSNLLFSRVVSCFGELVAINAPPPPITLKGVIKLGVVAGPGGGGLLLGMRVTAHHQLHKGKNLSSRRARVSPG